MYVLVQLSSLVSLNAMGNCIETTTTQTEPRCLLMYYFWQPEAMFCSLIWGHLRYHCRRGVKNTFSFVKLK